jgi:hypothetical protein
MSHDTPPLVWQFLQHAERHFCIGRPALSGAYDGSMSSNGVSIGSRRQELTRA